MKLARRLVLYLMVVVVSLLTLDAYLTVRRELREFEDSLRRESRLLGIVMASQVADVWRRDGIAEVHRLIEDTNRVERLVRVRWVWLDAERDDASAPRLSPGRFSPLAAAEAKHLRGKGRSGGEYLYTYVPIPVGSGRPAALELAASLAPMHAYARNTWIRNGVLIGVVLVVCSSLVFWLGATMVGRPIKELVLQARKIAAGDLTDGKEVTTSSGDEIGEMADELNEMFGQLRKSQRRLQQETERRVEALEQLHHADRLATIGKLSCGLAHELGTPLNVIAGRARMLMAPEVPPEKSVEYARTIRSQSERMTGIIQDLLTFSRRRRPEKSIVDLEKTVCRVVTLLRPEAHARGVTLRLGEQPDAAAWVLADADQIQQVLTNLIMNGLQAVSRGGTVEVGLSRGRAAPPDALPADARDVFRLSVRDDGPGISPQDLDHIFDPFFTTKKAGEGTGLGLSVAHDIVREHEGWFSVQSEPGTGSCFSIHLPAREGPCTDAS